MSLTKFYSYHQKAEIKKNLAFINLEYKKIKNYVNFEVFPFEQLAEYQIGYSIDSDGNSLVTDEKHSWDDYWIVIAYETMCGDPIIIELNENGCPVSILMHGMGSWGAGSFLANSMESFFYILKDIAGFLTEKGIVNGKRTIQNKELRALLNNFSEKDEYADLDIWESLLNPLFEIAEEYEESLKTKIQKMKKEGKKLTEISQLLNIQTKEVYEYIKKV
ncbi:SMI1/KNR4 family protein [Solibacillus silvestris]|uniref:SMI1/KNR4 family protein n=1 Tax=Solibacillus silvestris TaxID=76853 RepID=UPI003F7FC7C8